MTTTPGLTPYRTLTDRLTAERRHADDLAASILERGFSGLRTDGLVDDLRDTLDRIDRLTAELNGADE